MSIWDGRACRALICQTCQRGDTEGLVRDRQVPAWAKRLAAPVPQEIDTSGYMEREEAERDDGEGLRPLVQSALKTNELGAWRDRGRAKGGPKRRSSRCAGCEGPSEEATGRRRSHKGASLGAGDGWDGWDLQASVGRQRCARAQLAKGT
jgi:hypothetical protein